MRKTFRSGWATARLMAGVLTSLSLLLAAASEADAAGGAFAPVDRRGPDLTVPAEQLRQSLQCSSDVANADREPVLLTPATTVDSDENYGWNYEKSLKARGIPFCTSDVPGAGNKNMLDMQTRAEYVVYAIREVHRLAGRKIAVMGHSQGGQIMRWPLRFWPDTRPMVQDVIGLAGTNHGSDVINLSLCSTPCAESLQQQRTGSDWYKALNSGQETFAGIDYTEVYSHTDEFVQPNLDSNGTSSLHGPGRITNVALQDICPTNVTEHLGIGTIDATASALAFDALDHDGPAFPARIDRGVCTQPLAPGVDPVTGPARFAATSAQVTRELSLAPRVSREPALRCYVYANCPITTHANRPACLNSRGGASGTRLGPAVLGRTVKVQRRHFKGKRLKTRAKMDRYCATGGGSFRIGYTTSRLARAASAAERKRVTGRAVLILTSGTRYSVAAIKPGASTKVLRSKLKGERRYRIGKNTWYVAAGRKARLIYRTRGGKVQAVGIADKRLTTSSAGSKRVLKAWALG